jgi:hypothetical protein
LKRALEKETRARIEANERLVKRVANRWREEEGKKLYERLTAERQQGKSGSRASCSEEDGAGALAGALTEALDRRRNERD